MSSAKCATISHHGDIDLLDESTIGIPNYYSMFEEPIVSQPKVAGSRLIKLFPMVIRNLYSSLLELSDDDIVNANSGRAYAIMLDESGSSSCSPHILCIEDPLLNSPKTLVDISWLVLRWNSVLVLH